MLINYEKAIEVYDYILSNFDNRNINVLLEKGINMCIVAVAYKKLSRDLYAYHINS